MSESMWTLIGIGGVPPYWSFSCTSGNQVQRHCERTEAWLPVTFATARYHQGERRIIKPSGEWIGLGQGQICNDFGELTTCERDPEHPDCTGSPILIRTGADPYKLTSPDQGVLFDLDADGDLDQVAWTHADAELSWLAWDRDGNGAIDSGAELFGTYTFPGTFNGFDALKRLNSNGDGRIDAEDALWPELLLWTDRNHNGLTDTGELSPVSAVMDHIGLGYTDHHRVDRHGNAFRWRGFATMRNSPQRFIFDAILQVQ